MTRPDDNLKSRLIERAFDAGFDTIRVTRPDTIAKAGERLMTFLESGFHGDMHWLEAHRERRSDPQMLWPDVSSAVMFGYNYGPDHDPLAVLREKTLGAISVYAGGDDYHDIIKKKLKGLAAWFHQESGEEVKIFVDTAPLMEKPLAEAAGLGWQGKHTNLVSRRFGSWLFLGSLLTTADLTPDRQENNHCGHCRRCLDVCPTNAFPAPYQLDARRCISYLTIEHKGHIPVEFRAALGNRIFGCDDCLAVCPWNKFEQPAHEIRFKPRHNQPGLKLADLLSLDDQAFRAQFRGSPVKRTGRDRFIRNVLIAARNSGERTLLAKVLPLLGDASPLVRAMAVWTASGLCSAREFEQLKGEYMGLENDETVISEWLAPECCP